MTTEAVKETVTETYDDLVEALYHHQKQLAELRAAKEQMMMELEASPKYKVIQSGIIYATERIEALRLDLQIKALDSYVANGTTKPHSAVTVKVFTVMDYDDLTALEWARANLPVVLTLDRKMFEQFAKASAEKAPFPCVKTRTEPRVQIATDLSKHVKASG